MSLMLDDEIQSYRINPEKNDSLVNFHEIIRRAVPLMNAYNTNLEEAIVVRFWRTMYRIDIKPKKERRRGFFYLISLMMISTVETLNVPLSLLSMDSVPMMISEIST